MEKKKILVVDDSPLEIKSIMAPLKSYGYEVSFSLNPGGVHQYLKENPIDLLIIDIHMPGKNGLEVCQELKEDEVTRSIPIIVNTGDPNSALKSIDAGASDFIVKPFVFQELKIKVKFQLQLSDEIKEKDRLFAKLKETQAQLVQSEKMSSLGTLVAGVAHELNNPASFIFAGAYNLGVSLEELKKFLFELLESEPEIIKFLEEKFSKIFKTNKTLSDGSSRIAKIVEDLRTFSRLDEAERKTVLIQEGLEVALRFIKAQYQKGVDFICDFQDNPKVDCYPAQLNQVFMNIMVNACQAIKEKREKTGEENEGTLTIRTFLQEKKIAISFHDNGIGMNEEVKRKLFEPFFTTKEVGEGTGLGLSISHGIITKHEGFIEVESEEGKGTTITVFISLDLSLT